ISMSGWAPRIILNPCRTTAWSSASNMRIFFIAHRHSNFACNTFSGPRLHGQVAAGAARSGAHSNHPHSAAIRAGAIDAAAIVADREADGAVRALDADLDVCRAGMSRHVGQR